MKRILIIITRDQGEYDTFWKFDNSVAITPKQIDENHKVIFIKKGNRAFADYCPIITNQLTTDPPEEIGIILHLAGGNDEANSIRKGLSKEIKAKLKFCTWYSTTSDGFWDARELDKSLPYNALKSAIENGTEELAAFNKVWNFFLCDPVLEAKLELLQCILNDETPNPAILTLLRINLTNFDEDFKNFKKTPDTDIFSSEYRNAFGIFREALAVE